MGHRASGFVVSAIFGRATLFALYPRAWSAQSSCLARSTLLPSPSRRVAAVPRPGRHLECGVLAVRSGVLAFSGVPHFCISVIVLVVAFHGVPWWSILAWSGDLAFCGVPACRAGMAGVLAFQASL